MDIGPDGSLCHITSSMKDCVNNIKIVKVSEEEMLKNNGLPYKLIFINEENDCESMSEKSDEEPFEIESLDIEIKTENFEQEKNSKFGEVPENKPQNRNSDNKHFNQRHTKPRNRNYKNYNSSGTRNFKSSSNVPKSYNRQKANAPGDIDPWINPPRILSPMEKYPYAYYPQYVNMMEPHLNTSLNSSMDKPCGILGDSPYQHPPYQHHNYQTNNQNMFRHEQSYWNNEYPNNYPRTNVQQPAASNSTGFKKYHHNGKFWKQKGSQKSWKQNQNASQKERRNNYRKQKF